MRPDASAFCRPSVHLGVVVFARLRARVPALLLRVRDGLQEAGDRGPAVVETLKTVFWKHQDLGTLDDKRHTEEAGAKIIVEE